MRMPVVIFAIFLAVPAVADPALPIEVTSKASFDERAADPARPDALSIRILNATATTAKDIALRVTLPEGGTFVSATGVLAQCSVLPHEVVCRWPGLEVPRALMVSANIVYLPPDRDDGGAFPIRLEASASADGAAVSHTETSTVSLRRRLVVTHGGDSGPGSLRQAILNARAACASEACIITFTTTDVIRPVTPLPLVRGFVKIDGGELDGSLLSDGHAIASDRPCLLRVSNMRIHDFPGHAIDAIPDRFRCEPENLGLGVYVANNELWRNLRGVVVKVPVVEIVNNHIRDHRRAGAFVDGTSHARIDGNTITGNGASGVFVNLAPTQEFLLPNALVTNNVIRRNREWGLCRTANGIVGVMQNEIAENYAHAIDIGLDLDTPNRPLATSGPPNKPILFFAQFNPATGRTVVRGYLDRYSGRIDVYASRGVSGAGHPQAERLVLSAPERASDFQLEIPGDFRGQWITATSTRRYLMDWTTAYYDTSEISAAVPVH